MEIPSLGRYQIRDELGRGTMGVVYRGYDPVLDREIAIKTVDFTPGISEERRRKFLDRFFLEAKIAGKLIHPNIVVTHDAATDESTTIPFIAMELVTGGSLADVSRQGRRMSWEEATRLAISISEALDYAHQEGVVHRDIKPANVLLTGKSAPKIADFGIAKLPTSDLTHTGTVMGTPYYMSPEQLEGADVDGRSDLFSLGVLVYHLVAGEPPFRGPDLASITQQVLIKSPRPVSEIDGSIPIRFDEVLARAMAKRPGDRYGSGAELAQDLIRIVAGHEPRHAVPLAAKTIESTPAGLKRSSWRAWALLSLLVLGGAAVYRFRDVSEGLVSSVSAIEDEIRARQDEVDSRAALSAVAAATLEEGRDFLRLGHWDESRESIERALSSFQEARDGAGEAEALLLRGLLAAERGDWSKARADLEASASVFEIYDLPEGARRAVLEQARLARDLGRVEESEALFAGVEAKASLDVGLHEWMKGRTKVAKQLLARSGREGAGFLGAICYVEGDVEQAEQLWSEGDFFLWRGYGLALRGELDEARTVFEASARKSRSRQSWPDLASALDGLRLASTDNETTPELAAVYRRLGIPLIDNLPEGLDALLLAEPRSARSESRRHLLASTNRP